MVVETAAVLADIKNLRLAELEVILLENTKELYPRLAIEPLHRATGIVLPAKGN
jgi:hypothetical protein